MTALTRSTPLRLSVVSTLYKSEADGEELRRECADAVFGVQARRNGSRTERVTGALDIVDRGHD